ncbi:DUF3265 domain-containing protein [Vibrio cholerae]|nr:DUF3265 domain-containing protein [Vibrio cholerae]
MASLVCGGFGVEVPCCNIAVLRTSPLNWALG